MIRKSGLFLLFILFSIAVRSQTMKIKCNSAENLHLVLIGSDARGKVTSKVLYDVSQGFAKSYSVYKEKYGYDQYNNKEMVHEGTDTATHWREIHIYDRSNTLYSKLDVSQPSKRTDIDKTGLWVTVKQRHDRNYLITIVTINDK